MKENNEGGRFKDRFMDDLDMKQYVLVHHDGIMLSAEDMKQYIYCPRKLYYRHVMQLDFFKSFKMKRGTEIHEHEIKVRPIERDGSIERYYNMHIESPRLGLMTVLDAFEFDGIQTYPIEFKMGIKKLDDIPPDYKSQLVLQAILLEEMFKIIVTKGKFIFLDMKEQIEVPISISDKKAILSKVNEARSMIKNEVMPEPTDVKGRCTDCEMYGRCMSV
jgi:CRISPR-associated protein Cas4